MRGQGWGQGEKEVQAGSIPERSWRMAVSSKGRTSRTRPPLLKSLWQLYVSVRAQSEAAAVIKGKKTQPRVTVGQT